jgi:hypothetical protein
MFAVEATLGFIKPHTIMSKVRFTDYFENFYAAINSMHVASLLLMPICWSLFIVKHTPKVFAWADHAVFSKFSIVVDGCEYI